MLLLTIFATFCSIVFSGNVWVDTFTPLVEFYVSPTATNGDGSLGNPFGFDQIGEGKAGAAYNLMDGIYSNPQKPFYLSCAGTVNDPCVVRCMNHTKCTLTSPLVVNASYVWVWGLVINIDYLQNSETNTSYCGISVLKKNVTRSIIGTAAAFHIKIRIINNIITYSPTDSSLVPPPGLCFSKWDAQTIIYGNIITGFGHNMNVSNNDKIGSGYKYIVANVFNKPLDGSDFNMTYYNVNAVVDKKDGLGETSTQPQTGLLFTKNIINRGDFITGSKIAPDTRISVIRNLFGYSRCIIGAYQPTQLEAKGNILGYSSLIIENLWGRRENTYDLQAFQSVVSENVVFKANYNNSRPWSIVLSTSAHVTYRDIDTMLNTPLHYNDVWNFNTYDVSDFIAFVYVDGVANDRADKKLWKVMTRNGGNRFDENSSWITPPTQSFYFVLNEYDQRIVNLVVYNFDSFSNQATFDLCCFLGSSTSWSIADSLAPLVSLYDNSKDTCQSITVQFTDPTKPYFRNFIITTPEATNNDVLLRTCNDAYIRDIPESQIPSADLSKEIAYRTVTAAVVGSITLAIVVLSSAIFLYVRHRDMSLLAVNTKDP